VGTIVIVAKKKVTTPLPQLQLTTPPPLPFKTHTTTVTQHSSVAFQKKIRASKCTPQ